MSFLKQSHPRIAVNILFFVNGFMHANLAARFPRIQEIFSLDNGIWSIVLLATSVGAVLAMPFTGWLIIKNGSRTIAIVSVLSYCLFFPFLTYMTGLYGLIPLFFIMGVTAGMLDVSMNAQAVMVEKAKGKPIMTSFHALFSIGMAIGAVCGSFFAKSGSSLSVHLLFITAASLMAVGVACYHLIHDKPAGVHEGPAFRLPSAAMVSIGVIAFCCMLGEGAMADWSANYMKNIAGANEAKAALGLSAFALAMTIGRLLGDAGRAKYGDKRLMVVCGLIATVGLSFSVAFTQQELVMVGFFFVGLGLSVIVPIAYSIAGNSTDVSPGVGLAMVTTVGYTGFLFGPPMIGFLAEWHSLRVAFMLVTALFMLMAVLSKRYTVKA